MYEEFNKLATELFDIRELKNECNAPDCNKKPEKQILIYEFTIKRRVNLITLYLCSEHEKLVQNFIRKLKILFPKSIFETEIKDI